MTKYEKDNSLAEMADRQVALEPEVANKVDEVLELISATTSGAMTWSRIQKPSVVFVGSHPETFPAEGSVTDRRKYRFSQLHRKGLVVKRYETSADQGKWVLSVLRLGFTGRHLVTLAKFAPDQNVLTEIDDIAALSGLIIAVESQAGEFAQVRKKYQTHHAT